MEYKNIISSKTPTIDLDYYARYLYEECRFPGVVSFDYDGSKCFFKVPFGENELFNELFGEILCDYFNLESVHHRIARVLDNYGLFSYNFKSDVVEDFNKRKLNHECGTLGINEFFCRYDDLDIDLLWSLKKLTIIDHFMSQKDRGVNNLLEWKKDGYLTLAPIYDFEVSLGGSDFLKYQRTHCKKYKCYAYDYYLNMSKKEHIQYLKDDIQFQILIKKLYNLEMKDILNQIKVRHQINIPTSIEKEVLDRETYVKQLIRKNELVNGISTTR